MRLALDPVRLDDQTLLVTADRLDFQTGQEISYATAQGRRKGTVVSMDRVNLGWIHNIMLLLVGETKDVVALRARMERRLGTGLPDDTTVTLIVVQH